MGRVIIFPTDTVYGIGTSIYDADGVNRIYEIKKRPLDKKLACLCANFNQIESIAVVNDSAKKLINEFLPGALTVILKTKEDIREKIGYDTIGVRIPNHKIALDILNKNGPMLTTSVNESGNVPLNEYDEIIKEYINLVDEIHNTDTESSNISSTVVSAIDEIKILRLGEISEAEILACLKNE